MKDFNIFLRERLQDKDFALHYYRDAAYFRLADQMILLRKYRGLTQVELAQRAGTTQTVVSRLENASVRPSLETIVKLAGALDAAVEVHLIPLEGLQAGLAQEQDMDNEKPAEKDAFDLVKSLAGVDAKPPAQPREAVLWGQPNAWSLTRNPLSQPVGQKQKISEFA